MPELVFAYAYDTDITGLSGLDFNASGKICIMVGDIAPQGLKDEIWYALFNTQQTIYDIADDLKEDLSKLYSNAEIIVDRDTSLSEFTKYVFTPETIGAVFIGHGEKGWLSSTDMPISPSWVTTPTDLQFLLLFACEAGVEVDGSWRSLTKADVYYAPKGDIYMDLQLPFLDSIASVADRMMDELKSLKRRWAEQKAGK